MKFKIDNYIDAGHYFNGSFYGTEIRDAISYPNDGNESLYLNEDKSFWFRHRNNCILDTFKTLNVSGPLFDIGGGNGAVAISFQKSGNEVVLVEPGMQGVSNATQRGLKNVVLGTFQSCNFRNNSLPSVGLFDVVEHIENDNAFLKSLYAKIAPNGYVLITVPAYQFLWSSEDVSAGHFRRYTRAQLIKILKDAGFSISWASYFFLPLILPIFLTRTLPWKLGCKKVSDIQADHLVKESFAQKVITIFLNVEKSLLQHIRLPFGASILVVAKKEE